MRSSTSKTLSILPLLIVWLGQVGFAIPLSTAQDAVPSLAELFAKGRAYQQEKNFVKAIFNFQNAHSLAEQTGDTRSEFLAAHYLSQCAIQQHDIQTAREYLEPYRIVAENHVADEAYARGLSTLGRIYQYADEFETAVEVFQTVQTNSIDPQLRLEAQGNLALTLFWLGEYSRSKLAFEACHHTAGQDQKFVDIELNALLGLSNCNQELGYYAAARGALQRIRAHPFSKGKRVYNTATHNLATVEFDLENWSTAQELYTEALQLDREAGEPEKQFRDAFQIAYCSYQQNEHALAAQQLQDAFGLFQELGLSAQSPSHALQESLGRAYALKAQLHLNEGQLSQSEEFAHQSLSHLEAAQAQFFTLSPLLVLARVALQRGHHDQVGRYLVDAQSLFEEMTGIAEESSVMRSRFASWSHLEMDLVAAKHLPSDGQMNADPTLLLQAWWRMNRWKARGLYEGLTGNSIFEALHQPIQSWQNIRTAIQAKDVLLCDYFWGSNSLYGFFFAKDGLHLFELGAASDIRQQLNRFKNAIGKPPGFATMHSLIDSGKFLFKSLLQPAWDLQNGPPTHLVVIPTTDLNDLSFAALLSDTTGKISSIDSFAKVQFVLDTTLLHYTPSSLLYAHDLQHDFKHKHDKALIVADPIYVQSEAPQSALSSGKLLPELPGTRAEALQVARSLVVDKDWRNLTNALQSSMTENRHVRWQSEKLHLLLGAEARPENLPGKLEPYTLLHFGVHGIADTSKLNGSYLALSDTEQVAGRLNFDRIGQWNLQTDLTVLSACDTARGNQRPGEGTQSLGKLFLLAGSRSVLASAWPVDDQATAILMGAFYDNWQRAGNSKVSALQKAQLQLRFAENLQQGEYLPRRRGGRSLGKPKFKAPAAGHPYFWAPFLLLGNDD